MTPERLKRMLVKLFVSVVVFSIRRILAVYLWLWDEDAAKGKDAYLHQKIIWELRNGLKELDVPSDGKERA